MRRQGRRGDMRKPAPPRSRVLKRRQKDCLPSLSEAHHRAAIYQPELNRDCHIAIAPIASVSSRMDSPSWISKNTLERESAIDHELLTRHIGGHR